MPGEFFKAWYVIFTRGSVNNNSLQKKKYRIENK